MPQLNLGTVTNGQLQRIIDAFGAKALYKATQDDGNPNPLTPAEMLRGELWNIIRGTVRSYERLNVSLSATTEYDNDSNNEIVPT